MGSPCCVSVHPPPHQLLNGWTNLYETLYVYHGTWAHQNCIPHKSLPPVCVSVCVARQWLSKNPPIIARQRLGKSVTVATNTHTTMEELLDALLSMWSMYQRKQAIRSSQNFLFSFCVLWKINAYRLWCHTPPRTDPTQL
jgi:hypothetical protein